MSRIWALKTPRFAAYWFQSFVMSLDRRKRWYFYRFISSHDTHPLNWIHPRQMPTFLLSADKSIQVWKGNKCLPNQYFAIHPWNYENYKIKPKQKEKKRKQRSKLKKMSNKKEKKRHSEFQQCLILSLEGVGLIVHFLPMIVKNRTWADKVHGGLSAHLRKRLKTPPEPFKVFWRQRTNPTCRSQRSTTQ